jgi:hypothetical protein
MHGGASIIRSICITSALRRYTVKFSLRFVLILTALVAAAVLVLAVACGGDDDEEGPAAGETPAAAEETPEGPPPSEGETPEGPPPSEAGELPGIPAYPGAEEVFSGTFTGGAGFPIPVIGDEGLDPEDYGAVQYTMYETSDSVGKVVDFYKKEFKGWKEEWTFSMEQTGQNGEIVVWSKDDAKLAAWMSAFEDEGTTSVIVAMGASQ